MFLILGILHLFSYDFATADYCEFAWCEDDRQYCCGKNKCCDKNLDLTFVWAGILFVTFILAIIAIIKKWRWGQHQTNDYQSIKVDPI